MYINDIYKQYFFNSGSKDWELFKSKGLELLTPKEVDFAVSDEKETAQKTSEPALKVIFSIPQMISEAAKWVVQRAIMARLYPAQSTLAKLIIPQFRTSALDEERKLIAKKLDGEGYIVRHICFVNNGVKLSGLLIGHIDHIQNGKWALQAGGNIQPIEYRADLVAETYHKEGFNVLLINNPGVGRSEGTSTPDAMGEAQQMGITFLESALKAKKIVIGGFSLGGAAVGQGILKHTFKKKGEVDYLAIRLMTFDKASNLGHKVYNYSGLPRLIKWAGCEMDSIAASKKLQALGIPEAIIQSHSDALVSFDGVIPIEATLSHALQNDPHTDETKRFIGIENADHCDLRVVDACRLALQGWDSPPSLWARFLRYLFP